MSSVVKFDSMSPLGTHQNTGMIPASPVTGDGADDLIALTTMLDRALNPRTSMAVKIEPVGLFGLPDDLTKAVETTPIFAWRAKLWHCTVDGGKYYPRELTEEEQENLKTKKNLKTTKDIKDKVEVVVPADGKERDRWIADMEDKYKNASIKFPPAEPKPKEDLSPAKPGDGAKGTAFNLGQGNATLANMDMKASHNMSVAAMTQEPFDPEHKFKFNLDLEQIGLMEQNIQDGSCLLVLERYVNLPEEEVIKLRKKLKGAALKDLRTLVLHAQLDIRALQRPGSSGCTIRAPVTQIGDFTSDEECNEYKFVHTYVKVEINALNGEQFTPEIKELFPQVIDLSEAVLVPKISSKAKAENELTNSLHKALVTLSDDYKASIKVDAIEQELAGLEKLPAPKQRQLEQKKLQRQSDYIKKFMVSPKYTNMKSEITPLVLRVVHDKLEKEMVGDELASLDADRLISELNIYLQKKLEETISHVISQAVDIDFHKDFIQSFLQEKNAKKIFTHEVGKFDSIERLIDLAKEYEKLNLKEMAEKRFKDIAMNPAITDPQILTEFMTFDLRQQNFVRAEETLNRIHWQKNPEKDIHTLIKACFFIHRGLIPRALSLIEGLLQVNKFVPLHNSFMAFMQIFYMERPKLGKKYFAVSQRMKQRELGLIPPVKAKPDKNPEKLPDLPDKESDDLWLDLAGFFASYCFVDLSFKVIELVKNKESFRCLSIMSALEFLRKNLEKADEIHNKMLKVGGPAHTASVYMAKATNAFVREHFYEAEELIYASLKITGELSDPDMVTLPRLGYIYLRRKSFDDARVVFYTACKANPKSALNWLGLAISHLRIGERLHEEADYLGEADRFDDETAKREQGDKEYQKAQDALRMANIYDPTNSEAWCYSILLSLKDIRKLQQASKLLKYLMTLEVENLDLLNEVNIFYEDWIEYAIT